MTDDYFVVGPTLELVRERRRRLARAAPFPLALGIQRRRERVGRVVAEGGAGGIRMTIEPEPGVVLRAGPRAEVLKLFRRVCAGLAGEATPLSASATPGSALARLLAEDGFRVVGRRWIRPDGRRKRRRGGPARSMEEVYSDPFDVPWNFVPREWDVLRGLRPGGREAAASAPRVLDLGAGFGKNAVALEGLGYPVWGIDISPTAVRRCRRLVEHPRRFVSGSATALPWRDGFFDRVVDVGCVHCLPVSQRDAALAEVARVLAPGGVFLSRVFTPRGRDWLARQPFQASRFGMTADAARDLYAAHFRVSTREAEGGLIHLRCRPR